jgi:hypothetical protein
MSGKYCYICILCIHPRRSIEYQPMDELSLRQICSYSSLVAPSLVALFCQFAAKVKWHASARTLCPLCSCVSMNSLCSNQECVTHPKFVCCPICRRSCRLLETRRHCSKNWCLTFAPIFRKNSGPISMCVSFSLSI